MRYRRTRPLTAAGREQLAEVESLLIDHALGLGLAARVVVSGVVKAAVAANVQRATAAFAFVAETDPLDHLRRGAAMPTLHNL